MKSISIAVKTWRIWSRVSSSKISERPAIDSIQVSCWVVPLRVLLAFLFDFMNGFHDAANPNATVVSTGVLKPQQTVLFAAFSNVLAIGVFQLKVAATLGSSVGHPSAADHLVVFGALIGGNDA